MIQNLSLIVELIKIGIKREIFNASSLLSQTCFLFVLILIFSHLWDAVLQSGLKTVYTSSDFVWYFFVNELVLLSTPIVVKTIQEDIQTGDFEQKLIKPIFYPSFFFFQAFGTALVRYVFLMVLGTLFCLLINQALPNNTLGFISALFLVPVSIGVYLCILTCIGLLAYWIFDSTPIYWLISKATFILGGLFIPIFLYPLWLKIPCYVAPFSAILFGVSSLVFTDQLTKVVTSFGLLIFWGSVAFYCLRKLALLLIQKR
jgi:ABC-2 type transport system permease protein